MLKSITKFPLIFISFLLMNIGNYSKAQIAAETPMQKVNRILSGSNIIFEGVVEDQSFFETTPGNCWTASKVVITKIFKGMEQLKCGEAIIIHRGSSGQIVDFGNGPYWLDAPEHTIEYRVGTKGIFFCQPNNGFHPSPQNNPTTNQFLRTSFEQYDNFLAYRYDPRLVDTVSISTINNYANLFAGVTFDSKDAASEFLDKTYGINTEKFNECVPHSFNDFEQPNDKPVLINPKSETIKNVEKSIESTEDDKSTNLKTSIDSLEQPKKYWSKKKIQDFEEKLNYRIANGLQVNSSRSNEEITFTLENEKFTGTNPRYFEFDVMVACNQSGTYLDNAPIHLSYNTNAFGSNVVANNKIDVKLVGSFINPTYDDPNLLKNDWSSDTVVVLLGLDYNASLNRTQVPLVSTPMLHVKMQIAACYQSTDMYFVNQSIAQNVTWFTTTPTEPLLGTFYTYDAAYYLGNLNLNLCAPQIDNFNSPIRAGVDDILIIEGKHFGSSRGSGEVWLKDSDSGGALYIKHQDPTDYISWSDTEIRLKIPSHVNITLPNGSHGCAGSGKFLVKTNQGDSTFSSSNLNIQYAINNSPPIPTLGNNKFRYNLLNTNNEGSYTFHCDTSISNYPLRKAIVERAIHDWNCRTEVNWKLGNDTTLQFLGVDGVNLIYFDPNYHGAPLALTQKLTAGICQTQPSNAQKAYFQEVDIAISADLLASSNPNAYWWFDTTGVSVPANAFDFYGVLLHELGHAHAIGHVNDQNDIMYYSVPPGPTPSTSRNYNTWKWYNAIDAGVDVVTKSQVIQWNCSVSHLISDIEEDCYIINKVRDLPNENDVVIYPNPAKNQTFLRIPETNILDIVIYTISGSMLRVPFKKVDQSTNFSIYSIDISALTTGSYLISCQTTDGVVNKQILVQN